MGNILKASPTYLGIYSWTLRLRILCDSLMKTLMISAYISVLIFQFSLFLSSTL